MEEAERRNDSKKLFSIINKMAGKRAERVIGMEPVKNLSPVRKARCSEQMERAF
jgi:hypothetical protein